MAKTQARMAAFVTPLSSGDPEADPLTAFETEYRRTLGRIRWLDEELAQLATEALGWGLTSEVASVEVKDMSGGQNSESGTIEKREVTHEAKVNVLYELQFRERQHLVAMNKIYFASNLDQQRINIQRRYVDMLDDAIERTLRALGHDVSDPAVRQVVRDQLLALPAPS